MNCLVVGRTHEDVKECREYGLSMHDHAPTTNKWADYDSFDGDVISCQTIKPWSDFACSVEASKRVYDSAMAHPTSVIIGMSDLHKIPDDSPLWENAIIYDHRKGHRHPDKNTGMFALWWALEQGYEEVYTVGLDFVWDRELLIEIKGILDNHPSQTVYKTSKESWLPCAVKEPS